MSKKPISAAKSGARPTAGKRASAHLAAQLVPDPPISKRSPESFPLTMQQEMALAVILWRAVRFAYTREREVVQRADYASNSSLVKPKEEEKVNDTAIEMAERMGVKAEFFEWLFAFPVFKLYLLGLEPWPASIAGIVPKDRKLVTVEPKLPKRQKT